MAVRWETQAGPNGVKRFVRRGPAQRAEAVAPPPAPSVTQAQVDEALVELASDVETAAAQVRDIRSRVRALVKDARQRHEIRQRLSPRADYARVAGISGDHVRQARRVIGKSQREVAAFCGVHRSQVAEAELGHRPVPEPVGRWALGVLRAAGDWREP